jgi:proteasome lid subunit RPN8/RPN11
MAELDEVFVKEMVAHGLREFPNECCGLIAADGDGRPVKVFPIRNADASPVTYRFDADEHLKVLKELEANGWEMWAVYHSHTHTRAYPSETDIRQAVYIGPEPLYILISLSDRENPVVRAFRIDEGEVDEEELVIA